MSSTPRIILLLDAGRGFGRGMLSGIARYSALNGPWTFYRQPPAYLKSDSDFSLKDLKAWGPDGIICSIAHSKELAALKVPMVGYDPGNYNGRIPCVESDHAKTGRLAARHLLDSGLRHFAFCGFSSLDWSKKRCNAFCTEVKRIGVQVHVYDREVSRNLPWPKEEASLQRWIKTLPKPIGMFCVNDDRAISVYETCRVLGLGIPEDVSMIGADNDEYICELENPPLSSVRIASEQGGYQAARLLHLMMQGKEKMEGQRIIAHAIGVESRQSTDVLMVGNKDVVKALRFIRENVNRPVRVKDIIEASGLSHRALNDQFHSELGCSIGKQFTRTRVDYICRLLADTDMQIQEIATTVGYEDDRHFSRYFKRITGLTPQAYRRKISPP